MQNQSAQWLDIRRDKPDFVVMYGWGAMNPTAIKEAIKAGFPMDKFVSIWWPGDNDAAAGGDGAKGFKELNWHGTGTDFQALRDIKKLVIDAGKSQTPAGEFGQVLYDRGVYNSVLIAEGIAEAQKITGKKVVTGEDVRRGLENLDLDAARFKALGLEGFAAPFKLTCADHNSHSATFVQQWDGAKWVKVSDPIAPATALVEPLLERSRQDLCGEERGLAEAQRAVRQQVASNPSPGRFAATFSRAREKGHAPLPLAGEGRGEGPLPPSRKRFSLNGNAAQ